ncbi:MAG TPA: periplasmic heavy metal sensor [Deltaproteobacteria bacterium]|nr:periplasmic heavy metal sensor [Deltaproteobacteria bacterium]
MKKLMLTLAASGLVVLLAMPSFAIGPREGRGPQAKYGNTDYSDRGYHRDKALTRLNLTDEQKTKIEALRLAHDKNVRPIREEMFDKSVELRRLWLQPDPDKNKINAKQKEVRALRNKLEDKRTDFRLEVNKVLTPEQKETLATYGWGRKPGYGPRGGKRGPGSGYGPGICY